MFTVSFLTSSSSNVCRSLLATAACLTLLAGCAEMGAPDDYGTVEGATGDSGIFVYALPTNIYDTTANATIDYEWGLENNGGSQWLTGMQLRPVTSTQLVNTSSISVPDLDVEERAELTATGNAPRALGLYTEYWELVDGSNNVVPLSGPNTSGGQLVIQVRVL